MLGVMRKTAFVLLLPILLLVLAAAVPLASAHADNGRSIRPDRFGRMFPGLPPAAQPSEALTDAIADLGQPGGLLDAKDPLERGPIDLIVDPALSAGNPNNPNHPAGTTFLGQFIDHDLTLDAGSPLGVPTDPRSVANLRTPRFDLDSVYGGGPWGSPELYDPHDRVKLLVESGGLFEDLPRRADGSAILVEGRNDENLVIAGLHAAFLRFHNHAVDLVRAQGARNPTQVFLRARRLTRWHYQWVVLNEFLPQVVGQERVAEALSERSFFRPTKAFIPVEFQAAAYRFGHSMVRPSYRANLAGDNGTPFFGFIFDPTQFGQPDPDDLTGGSRAPRRFIGWQTFFDFGDGAMRTNKRIDTRISTPLFNLPVGALPGGRGPASLVHRNLLRGLTWSLPSGQSVAAEMGVPALTPSDLSELAGYGLGLESATPLWYYVLKEAEVLEDGLRLGPVGGRIVAEVFVGLLQLDRTSYLNQGPHWRPTLPSRQPGRFTMIDFLTFAGVDPAHRGQ
jgi:Animal haem peroxidase